MIKYATLFIILAIISAFLGYGELIGGVSIIAKMLFFLFIGLYIVTLLTVAVRRNQKTVNNDQDDF